MAERNQNGWEIKGTGIKPSLTFVIERDAKLDAENNGDWHSITNPQPKYQYVIEVTWTDWATLFEQAKISTGWSVGKLCREGEFTPNAHKDDKGKIILNEGAEPIKLELPLPRRARTVRKLTPEEMVAQMSPEEKARLKALLG